MKWWIGWRRQFTKRGLEAATGVTLVGQRNADYELAKWRTMARAAIAAMREPTRDMLFATNPADIRFKDAQRRVTREWQAMIDAALDEKAKP